MKKLKHYLTASIGLILFVSVIALSLPQTGHSNVAVDKDVRVINTPDEPIPVVTQGTTNVAVQNVPPVKAQQNGTWKVDINGTPTVQLDDSSTNPVFVRDVDRPTAQPYQKSVDIALASGEISKYGAIPVPNGKIFVIEQISGFGTGVPGEIVDFSILTNAPADSGYQFHYLLTTKEEIPGNVLYRLSQQVRLYSNDVPFPLMRVDRFPANSTISFKFTVSGYLVNK